MARVMSELSFDEMIVGISRERYQDSIVSKLVENHADKTGLIVKEIVDAHGAKRSGLLEVIQRLSKHSLPTLHEMALGTEVSQNQTAVAVLSHMGEGGADIALDLIKNQDPAISDRGAQILRNMGFEAVPFLREKLSQENPSKRGLAILLELDPDAVTFFKNALTEILGTEDQILSRYAIDAAASIGDYAIPVLFRLIGSHDPFAQQNATNALIKIGEPVVVELVEELDNPSSLIQQNAIRALKEIGLSAAPALKEALNSESQLIKQNAASVLKSPAFKSNSKFFSRFRR